MPANFPASTRQALMSQVFLFSAAIGGVLLVAQFLLLLSGAGADSDVESGIDSDVGHDQSAFLKLFSVQTISTFGTFFGLIGLGTESLGWSPTSVVVAATGAGVLALWVVAKLMRGLAGLQSSGNVDLKQAIGTTTSVYLRIPPAGAGHGRLLLQVQGRTVECRAISRGDEIATGARVRVVECQPDDLLVVEPIA